MKKVIYFLFLFISPFILFSQSVSETGSLSTGRWAHQTQLLSNGKVLIFGGSNGLLSNQQRLSSSELYDPVSRSWENAGSLNIGRDYFSSILLDNGNVMAIGGGGQNGESLSSCEIFDVTTETWQPAPSMITPRVYHSSVKLRNGKVLVAGGQNNKAEIFDPQVNKWSSVGDMKLTHGAGMAMIVLDDGKVFAMGGERAPKRAEIYDPETEEWTLVSATSSGNHYFHSIIRLQDGNFLIVGTQNVNTEDQLSAELYAARNQMFFPTGNLLTNVGASSMILMDDGRVLLYSMGDFFTPTDTKCIQVYNPLTGTWSADPYTFIGTHLATINKLHDGKILLAGGSRTTGNGASNSCYLVTQNAFPSCVPPNTSIAVTGAIGCNGNSVSISISDTETELKYEPYAGGKFIGDTYTGTGSSRGIPIYAAYLSPGKNIVQVKVIKPGCPAYFLEDTAVVDVSLPALPKPIITPNGPTMLCPDQNVQLSAPVGMYGYQWTNGSYLQNITVSTSGSYRVRVRDNKSCYTDYSDPVKVVMNPSSINAGIDQTICEADSLYQLTGFTPEGGIWSGNGIRPSGLFDLTKGAGVYTLTYSLCGKSATKRLTINPKAHVPEFTVEGIGLSGDSLCAGNSGKIKVVNPVAGVFYQLRIGNTNVPSGSLMSSGTVPIPFNTGYLYNTTEFNIMATHVTGCGDNDTLIKFQKMTVIPAPTAPEVIYEDTVCNANVPEIKIPHSREDLWYRLNYSASAPYVKGNGDTLRLYGHVINGSYTYQIESQNILKCGIERFGNIKIHHLAYNADFIVDPGYFLGDSVKIQNRTPGDFYKWSFDNSASILSGTMKNPEFKYNTTGMKSIKLLSESKFGCIDSLTRKIQVYEKAPESEGNICHLDSVGFGGNPIVVAYHVDDDGNSYVSRSFFTTSGGNYSGSCSMRFSKYDSSGKELWHLNQSYDLYPTNSHYYGCFITGISTDHSNNVYVTGSFAANAIKFGDITITSNGRSQFFVLKLDEAGNVLWAIKSLNTNGGETGGTDIKYVDDQHIYVSVYNPEETEFTDFVKKYFDNRGFAVLQINSDGKLMKYEGDSPYSDPSNSHISLFNPVPNIILSGRRVTISPKMAIAADGDIFIVGKAKNTLTFGDLTVAPVNPESLIGYVALLNMESGWKKVFTTYEVGSVSIFNPDIYTGAVKSLPDVMPVFYLDEAKNIYVSDAYNSPSQSYTRYIQLPGEERFVSSQVTTIAKYNANGNLLWHHTKPGWSPVHSITGFFNQIFLYGEFEHVFGGISSTSHVGVKSKGDTDIFLSSVDPGTGAVMWIEGIGGSLKDHAYFMEKNSCNKVTFLGSVSIPTVFKTQTIAANIGFISTFTPSGDCASSCTVQLLVMTAEISNITSTSATSGGYIISDINASVTEKGVCWSTNPNPTIADNKTVDGDGIGLFNSFITNLNSDIRYYLRAYATNSNGTVYGNEVSFLTPVIAGFRVAKEGGISIYPNPGNGIVSLDLHSLNSECLDIRVLDAKGGSVCHERINQISGSYMETFDWGHLSKGIYFIHITTSEGTFTEKLIISE